MKRKSFIIFLLLLISNNVVSVMAIMSECRESARLDTIQVNEVVHKASKEWNNLISDDYFIAESEYDFDYAIIDSSDKLLFTTDTTIPFSVVDATAERCTIRVIEADDEIIGWLIIPNDAERVISDKQRSIIITSLITNLIIIVLIAVYYIYLDRRVIKPFNKLKRFAENIARGGLTLISKPAIVTRFTDFQDLAYCFRSVLVAKFIDEQMTFACFYFFRSFAKKPSASFKISFALRSSAISRSSSTICLFASSSDV